MADNASSKAFDYAAKNVIDLARVEAGSVAKVKTFLSGLETDLVAILNQNKDIAPGKKAKLETILKAASTAIDSTYQAIGKSQATDLGGIAKLGSTAAVKGLNHAIGVDVFGAVLTESQLAAVASETAVFGHASGDWWKSQNEGLRFKFAGQMKQGYALGEDVDALVRRVRGTKAAGFKDGIMQASRREAEALVRSSIQTISNEAALKSYAALGDTIKGIEWLATLDTRTTVQCRALDGKVWTVPDLKPVGHDKKFPGPVAHWGCRSRQIPVLRSWAELSGKPIKALDGDTFEAKLKAKLAAKGMSADKIAMATANARASMDGQASGSPDMEAWLKSKPDSFIKGVLGPTRAKMLAEGKITIADLTDQNNRPLTIAELQAAIDGGGFAVETEGVDFAPFDKSALKKFDDGSAAAAQDAAKAKIAAVLADPKAAGNSILSANLAKIQAAEPSLTPAELLAKAEEATAAKIAANTKSSILSKAKKKMVAGEEPTPSQKALIDDLGEDEKAAFLEAVADAKTAKQITEANAAATAKLTSWSADPIKQKAIDKALADGAAADKPLELAAAADKALGDLVAGETAGNQLAAAKKAMKALTGMNAPTPASVQAWLKQQGKDPGEFLAEFQAVTKEKSDQSSKSSVLSKAKKKVAVGEAMTPAQQKIYDDLTPEEQASFASDVEAMKAKAGPDPAALAAAQKAADEAAQKAAQAAAAMTAAESKALAAQAAQAAKSAQATVPHPDKLKIVKTLGGSTGAQLAEDADGNRYVVKRGAEPDHVRTEFLADELYRAMGHNVPEGGLFETKGGPVKVTKFLDGGVPLASLTGKAREDAFAKLREGFVSDAMLANWDVAGTGLDNVMVTPDGKVWRIDNGGSLQYRAQGDTNNKNWNRYPDELFSMRQRPNISAPIYESMDFLQISRQIESVNWDDMLKVPMPEATRSVLEGRVAEMRRLSTRAFDFNHDGYQIGHIEHVAKATLEIRQTGISDALPKTLAKSGASTSTLVDEFGNEWGNLRKKSATANMTPPALKLSQDVFSDDIVKASSAMASAVNQQKVIANCSVPGKVATIVGHKPALKKLLKDNDPAVVAMAKDYLAQIELLETMTAKGGIPTENVPFFKPKELAQPKATPQKIANGSIVEQWEAMMKAEGIDISPVSKWQETQSGDSWSEFTQGMKYAFAKSFKDPESEFYWGGAPPGATNIEVAKKNYRQLVTMAGSEEKLTRLVTSWHAVTQEILQTIDVPWIDRERRAVYLVRTVSNQELAGSIKPPKKVGGRYEEGEFIPLRGTTESHSIHDRFSYKGQHTTVQAVPFSRVLSTFWAERPGRRGAGGFAGDGEQEFAANTSGLPARLVPDNSAFPKFDDKSKNAATWGVPIDHLRKP